MTASIENIAASRISNDPAVRTQVVEKVQVQLTEVEQVIEKARQLTGDIQKEREEASEALKNNLEEILDMVRQIKDELSESTESNNR